MELKEAIAGHLSNIDAELSAYEVPLKIRPLRASIMFVKDYVSEVSGDDKNNFEAKPWFAIIYHHVEQWYRDHYGPAFDRDRSAIASGVVLVRDIPVEIRVLLTRSRVETPGETAWLLFPVEVAGDENPFTWLVDPPKLDKLLADERSKLTKQTTDIGTALRAIRINLMGVEPSDNVTQGLLDGVLAELEASARNILRNDTSGRGSALWALQMAVERTLKALSQHKRGSFREIHNLFELFDDVTAHLSTIDRNLLKKLPHDKQVITDRYGLGGTPTLWEAANAYNAALEIISGISRLFKHKFYVGGGGVLLKRPPWLSLPSEDAPTNPQPPGARSK